MSYNPQLSNQYYDQGQGPPRGGPTEADGLMQEKPRHNISPEESVYSAILFLPAISRLKDGTETNRSARLALFLVFLNAILQMGVVQVINIYDHNNRMADTRALIPVSDVVSQGKRRDVFEKASKDIHESQNKAHRQFLLPNEKAELDSTKEIIPLCQRIGDGNGTFTCMPHSVLFVYEWKNLDVDGNGIWTFEEAHHDINKVKARLHVSPETIFNNILNGLHMTSRYFDDMSSGNHSFYLTADVREGRAIPKAYFEYWTGDAMTCSLFDSSSCEAAARDGVFKEALHPGRISAGAKGIKDLDSAIEYCYRMLQPGGGCETLLPTDFKRNREQRWGRCGARSLVEGGKYINPYNLDQSVHVLSATYASVNAYERATSRLFLFFLSLIIMLWLLSLVDEVRELIKFGEFLVSFPGISPGSKGGSVTQPEDENSEVVFSIEGLSKRHRAVLVVVFIARCFVCIVLANFGTRFLLVETDYLNLVMNSLALTFILTIDSMLYGLVEKHVTAEMNCAKDIEFVSHLPSEGVRGYVLKKECWGLFLVPVLSICIVWTFNQRQKEPVLTALRCACLQEGQKCLDSMQYQTGWWASYWGKVLPGATHQIEHMRLSGM